MKYDYLVIDGKKYRIEFNWNAIGNFLDENGLELSKLDDLKLLKPSQITNLIYHAVREGSRMDKQKFDYSMDDVGAVLSIQDVTDLLIVFQSHVNRRNPGETGKKKMIFNRKT